MKLLALLISGIIIAAMASTDDKRIELDREFELAANQSGVLNSDCLRIEMEPVAEDSRCPTGADCIWSGNAIVRLKVSKNGGEPIKLDLNTHLDPKKASFKEYEIELRSLAPYPRIDSAIRKSDYRAILIVSKPD